jgi:hypothetical protein
VTGFAVGLLALLYLSRRACGSAPSASATAPAPWPPPSSSCGSRPSTRPRCGSACRSRPVSAAQLLRRARHRPSRHQRRDLAGRAADRRVRPAQRHRRVRDRRAPGLAVARAGRHRRRRADPAGHRHRPRPDPEETGPGGSSPAPGPAPVGRPAGSTNGRGPARWSAPHPKSVASSRPALSVAATAAASDREKLAAGFGYVQLGPTVLRSGGGRPDASMKGSGSVNVTQSVGPLHGLDRDRRCGDPRRVRAGLPWRSHPAPAPTRTPPATPGVGWRAPPTLRRPGA